VHLNRIIFDMDTLRNVKVNDRFEFPQKLNMRQYMLDEVIARDKEAMKKKKAAAAEADRAAPEKEESEVPAGK
jgi:hypothetical protein